PRPESASSRFGRFRWRRFAVRAAMPLIERRRHAVAVAIPVTPARTPTAPAATPPEASENKEEEEHREEREERKEASAPGPMPAVGIRRSCRRRRDDRPPALRNAVRHSRIVGPNTDSR